MHEISIVVFTLLVQLSVGMGLAFAIGQSQLTINQGKGFLFTICTFATLGLFLSFTHLGYVWNAPFAITHFMTSWLSREIILTSAFLGCFGLAFLIYFFKNTLLMPLIYAGVFFGIADIYAMGHIYTAASVAIWQSWATFAGFFGAVLTGLCLSILAIHLYRQGKLLVWPIVVMAVGAVIRIYAQTHMLAGLDTEVESLGIMFPLRSEMSFRAFVPYTYMAWGLFFVSIMGLTVMAVRKKISMAIFALLSTGVLVAEFILRVGFYNF